MPRWSVGRGAPPRPTTRPRARRSIPEGPAATRRLRRPPQRWPPHRERASFPKVRTGAAGIVVRHDRYSQRPVLPARSACPISTGTRAQARPAAVAERHGRGGSQAAWPPSLALPASGPMGSGPCAEGTVLICPGVASRRGLPYGVQLGFMGVQLGGKVIWAGLLGCGCGAGTGEQQREAVAVLP